MKKHFIYSFVSFIIGCTNLFSTNLTGDDYRQMLGNDNWGTKFYMTFHPCWEEVGGGNFINIYVLSESKTEVTLEIKGKNVKKTLTTIPNDIVVFTLTVNEAFCYSKGSGAYPTPPRPAKVWVDNAIVISSKAPVSVSAIVRFQYTSDGYLAMPVHQYGTNYQVASYADPTNNTGQFLPSYTSVVGVYDNTKFTFKLGGDNNSQALIENGDTLKLGQEIERTINEGDVWLVAGIGAFNDLTGSIINSDKPVAVYSGNFCAYVPTHIAACDYLIEQETPSDKWGYNYYISPIISRKNFPIIKIFAKEANTKVFADSVPMWTITTPGGKLGYGFIETRAGVGTPRPVLINSDEVKPINVVLYNPGQQDDNVPSDPFQMQIVPKEQFKNEYLFHPPGKYGGLGSFRDNYINLIYKATSDSLIPDDFMIGTYFNGVASWVKLKDYSSNPGLPVNKDVPDVNGRRYFSKTIKLVNDSNTYIYKANDNFGLSLYGFSDYDSYGYPVGQNTSLIYSKDSLPPIPRYKQNQPGLIIGSVEDVSQNSEIKKAKLGMIFQIDSLSSNTKFVMKDYVIGIDTFATWKLMPINCNENGYSTLYFSDRKGNDTIIFVNNTKADFSGFHTELLYPSNNDTILNRQVEFKWKNNSFAETYTLHISKSLNFNDTVYFNQMIEDTSVSIVLPNNHIYFWRVKVNNSCWETNWTSTNKFLLSTFGYLKIVYVNQNALGQNNGKNWIDAFTDLQTGIDSATYDVQVWVAKGTYFPQKENGGVGQRFRTFLMNKNIYLYGGFFGNENEFTLRDFQVNKSIMSGDIGISGDSTDNCYHVLTFPANVIMDTTTIIDGFTITKGNSNGAIPDNKGGGILLNRNGSPNISNCIFTNNSASYRGGAIYNGETNLRINNSFFSNNYSGTDGGAVFNYYAHHSTFNGCTLESNISSNGAGLYLYYSDNQLINQCIISKNNAAKTGIECYGGGLYSVKSNFVIANSKMNYNNSNNYGGSIYSTLSICQVINTIFDNNQSKSGGAYYSDKDTIVIINCNIAKNMTNSSHGGFLYSNISKFDIQNCTLDSNQAQINGGGIYSTGGSGTITYSKFNINKGSSGGAVYSNSLLNIDDCNFYSNSTTSNGGAIGSSASLTINRTNLTNNKSTSSGGAIYSTASLIIDDCQISDNLSNIGAGIYINDKGLNIKRSKINNNKSTNNGGGIYSDGSINVISCMVFDNQAKSGGGFYSKTITLINSLIENNISTDFGGGIYNSGTINCVNSTLSQNISNFGGGIYINNNVTHNIKNTIIWNNSATTEGKQIYKALGTLNINNSCFPNNASDIFGVFVSNNCIFTDPKFFNSENKDFRIDRLSSCIDKGNDSYITELYDIRGDVFLRKLNGTNGSQTGIVDIGAYEFNFIYDTLRTKNFLINLSPGWNLISSNITPTLPDSMQYIWANKTDRLVITKNNAGSVYIPQFGINSIGKWDITQGYQVYMSAADTLVITGELVVPAETGISLKSGWNMIAYLRNTSMEAPLAFVSITDNGNLVIAKNISGQVYIPSFGINSIGNLVPGQGYRVYVTNNDTLFYPNN